MGQKRTSEGECRGRLSEIWAGGITLGLTYCEVFRTDFTVHALGLVCSHPSKGGVRIFRLQNWCGGIPRVS